jgi:2,3-bisphosphoglycerate-dependent phosphoglycerate mutase
LTDVDITEKGAADAHEVGTLLKDMSFDVVYTSEQRRTHQTLAGILKGSEHGEVTHHAHGALNERDYGNLTGKNKWEVQEEIGEEAFKGIRRGWDYPVPGGETLKDVYLRVVPFFDEEILPRLKRGENVLMVAHGNSLRALMKHLEAIHEDEMANVEMPFGHVHVYHVNPDGSIAYKQTRAIETGPINA